MTALQQNTVAGPIIFAGVGLHTGERVRAAILPAQPNAGITFVRTDLQGDNRVRAHGANVVATRLGTVIGPRARRHAFVGARKALRGIEVDLLKRW